MRDCSSFECYEEGSADRGCFKRSHFEETSISEIRVVEGVYPWLQTIDFSENIRLKQVIALSATLVRANLQNCSELVTLKNLSSLVNVKFLNINGCFVLETLSIRGLISLEEIETEKCWKLKRIDGLSFLKRLNRLTFSTSNGIFWEDVCKFLKSASSESLTNFILLRQILQIERMT